MGSQTAEFEWLQRFGIHIEEFKGEGALSTVDRLLARCTFACAYLEDGRILAECHLEEGMLALVGALQTGPTLVDLEGRTIEGLQVLARRATIGTWEHTMGQGKPSRVLLRCPEVQVCSPEASAMTPVQVPYGVANLEFLGDEVRDFEVKGKRRIARDTFRFHIGSKAIVVRQLTEYRAVVEQMKARRSLAVTAEATVEVADSPADLQLYDNMMDAICTLFSLAKGSKVRWIYSKILSDAGGLVSMRMISRPSRFWVPGGEVIGGATGAELKDFVAHSYDAYLQQSDKYNLPVAIGYYLASKSESEWNTRFILACTAMETLKGNLARHGKHGGSFRQLVEKMLSELGVSYTDEDLSFIKLRDKVVHTGVLGKSFRETWPPYADLISLLDRTFLKILRYRGQPSDYTKQWVLT
jgi:hypothetical protein